MEKPGTFKAALNFGLMTGAVMILYSLILYIMGSMQHKVLAVLVYIILIVGMVMAVKDFRDKKNGGFISFGKAFTLGFYVLLIAAVVAGIYNFLFFQFFDPGVLQEMVAKSEENLRDKYPNWSDEQIETAAMYSQKFITPVIISVMGLIYTVVIGLIIDLIVAAAMKKEGTPFTPAENAE